MITEDYISFETTKLLKEKGFDIPCNAYFVEVEKETTKNKIKRRFCHSSVVANRNAYKSEMANHYYFSCPTLQMAMKWLFEKKNCIVLPVPRMFNSDGVCDEWGYNLWVDDNLEVDGSEDAYDTREEAENAGIEYCLKNIIL